MSDILVQDRRISSGYLTIFRNGDYMFVEGDDPAAATTGTMYFRRGTGPRRLERHVAHTLRQHDGGSIRSRARGTLGRGLPTRGTLTGADANTTPQQEGYFQYAISTGFLDSRHASASREPAPDRPIRPRATSGTSPTALVEMQRSGLETLRVTEIDRNSLRQRIALVERLGGSPSTTLVPPPVDPMSAVLQARADRARAAAERREAAQAAERLRQGLERSALINEHRRSLSPSYRAPGQALSVLANDRDVRSTYETAQQSLEQVRGLWLQYTAAQADIVIGLLPVVGEIVDAIEASTGRAVSLMAPGAHLSGQDRAMAASGLLLGLLTTGIGNRLSSFGRRSVRFLRVAGRLDVDANDLYRFATVMARLENTPGFAAILQRALTKIDNREALDAAETAMIEELLAAFRQIQRFPNRSRRPARYVEQTLHGIDVSINHDEFVNATRRAFEQLRTRGIDMDDPYTYDYVNRLYNRLRSPKMPLVLRRADIGELRTLMRVAQEPNVISARFLRPRGGRGDRTPDIEITRRDATGRISVEHIEVRTHTQARWGSEPHSRDRVPLLYTDMRIAEKLFRGQISQSQQGRIIFHAPFHLPNHHFLPTWQSMLDEIRATRELPEGLHMIEVTTGSGRHVKFEAPDWIGRYVN